MSVNGITNSTAKCGFIRKTGQKLLNVLPNFVAGQKSDKFHKFVGKNISSAENRLILGTTALLSQPFIDLHNRKIDEDTRQVSVCRTIAKIIAGTTTGYIIRKGTIKLIDACSKAPSQNTPKWRTIFTPKNIKDVNTDAFKQYRNAMGTFIALGIMVFTNFLIDAPLTRFLTNKFNDSLNKRKESVK